MPVRVAVMNDYALVVRGVAALLAPFADRVQVVELDSQLRVERDVDVLLYDAFTRERIAGPLRDVLDQTVAPVVIYTWHTDAALVQESMDLGVSGWVSKTVAADELVGALEQVAGGETVRLLGRPREDTDDLGTRWPGREHGLSPREAEVLALIAQGLSNAEVADRAYVSANTLKTFIRSAYRKIGVSTRSQAVAWAARHGFLPDVERTFPT